MSPSPLRVALTGGIATGKSYCLGRFAGLGLPVIDADEIARGLVEAGSTALTAIIERFGPNVRRTDGELNRRALADIVFTDAASRSDLEAILHPLVHAAIEKWFESLASSIPVASGPPPPPAVAPALEDSLRPPQRGRRVGDPGASRRPRALAVGVAMADIPLLYETGWEADFDLIVVAACGPEQQLERMVQRGYTVADATARLASQLPIGEKTRRADYVIDTSRTTGETDEQIANVYGKLVNF